MKMSRSDIKIWNIELYRFRFFKPNRILILTSRGELAKSYTNKLQGNIFRETFFLRKFRI